MNIVAVPSEAADAPPRPGWLPGRLIVKFKPTVERCAHCLFAQGRTFAGVTGRGGLDRLTRSHGVRAIRPLLAQYHAPTLPESRRLFTERGQDLARSHPARLQRAGDAGATDLLNLFVVEMSAGHDVVEAARDYAADPDVLYAQPDFLYTTDSLPNDPFLRSSYSWGQPFADLWGLDVLQAPEAWNRSTGDGVRVAVIDTGVDMAHEDLQGQLVDPADVVDTDTAALVEAGYTLDPGEDYQVPDADPADRVGHGTHVAGTIAASADNGVGMAGVAFGTKIIPVRAGFSIFVPWLGWVGALDNAAIVAAIVYAVDHGADIINMSFGGWFSQAIADALADAASRGVVLVAAAGNESLDVERFSRYPAADPFVIAVAATDSRDQPAYFTNFGLKVDVSAPGGGDEWLPPGVVQPSRSILSLLASGSRFATDLPDLIVGARYIRLSGTSMSAPHVSGAAALLLVGLPGLTRDDVRQVLRSTADPINSSGDQIDPPVGTGRINARRALAVGTTATATLTAPRSGAIVRAGETVVTGVATGPYTLEVGPGFNPRTRVRIGSGTGPASGTLSEWFAHDLVPGEYALSLRVGTGADRVRDVAFVTVNGGLASGWPQATGQRPILGSPTIADLDGDGEPEILMTTYGDGSSYGGGAVFAWHGDGAPVAGWPQLVAYPVPSSCAVGDVDGDGQVDVAVGSWYEFFVWNGGGVVKTGWPKAVEIPGSPVLANLTGSAGLEIVVAGEDAGTPKLFAWQGDGADVAGWPKDVGSRIAQPVVADLDGDGAPEVVGGTAGTNFNVARTETKQVYVWRADGALFAGWPRATSGWVNSAPVVGDLDGNGTLEIVAVAGGDRVYAWRADGTALPGWPISAETSMNAAPILADLEGDGDLEIVFGGGGAPDPVNRGKLEAYHHTGVAVAGWPVLIPPYKGASMLGTNASPAVADLDGDNDLEVLLKSYGLLNAWHHDGLPAAGFPLIHDDQSMTGTLSPSPAVTDADGDGLLDAVAGTSFERVFVFGLGVPYVTQTTEWPAFLHDARHTGTHVRVPKPAPARALGTLAAQVWRGSLSTTRPYSDRLVFTADLTLGPASDGIDPGSETVMIGMTGPDRTHLIGSYPAGRLRADRGGKARLRNRQSLGATRLAFRPAGVGRWTVTVRAKYLSLPRDSSGPFTMTIVVGDDVARLVLPCVTDQRRLRCP